MPLDAVTSPVVRYWGLSVAMVMSVGMGGSLRQALIAPNVLNVPGVPAVVQTHPMVPPAAGAELNTMSPTLCDPVEGADVADWIARAIVVSVAITCVPMLFLHVSAPPEPAYHSIRPSVTLSTTTPVV